MPDELKDWERTFYQAGGGSARLSFLAFGHFTQPLEISMGSYYTAGVPDFVDVSFHSRKSEPDALKSYLQGYAADWLRANDTSQFSTVRLCEEVVEVAGVVPDPLNLNYLRDVIGIVAGLMDRRGVAVLDRTAQRWWRPLEWKEQVWCPHAVNAPTLINTVVAREASGAAWGVTTRGMLKFGRPDIRIRKIPKPHTKTAVELANRLASMLALGAVVPDGKVIKTPLVKGQILCRIVDASSDPAVENYQIDIEFPNGG